MPSLSKMLRRQGDPMLARRQILDQKGQVGGQGNAQLPLQPHAVGTGATHGVGALDGKAARPCHRDHSLEGGGCQREIQATLRRNLQQPCQIAGTHVHSAATPSFAFPSHRSPLGERRSFHLHPHTATVNAKTVLLVDDDCDSRVVYATILEYAGYRVIEAEDGERGLWLACEHLPDLVVLELSVPILDGFRLTEHLKRDGRMGRITVLAVSAFAMATDRERALRAGCDGYLAKPCRPTRVLEEVQRFIGPSRELVA